jgi:large subunit ribosomal protein L18
MNKPQIKIEKRQRRHKKIRSRISGTSTIPRISVFRSNSYIYAQLIDDVTRKTIVSVSSIDLKKSKKMNKVSAAFEVGKELAKKASDIKVKKVVFDRGGYIYTGRVKSLADGAREGGLNF